MSKKLKIVSIVNRIVAPPIDGGASYVFNTAKCIAAKGHKVAFVSFKSNKHIQNPEMIKEFADIYYDDFDFKDYGALSIIKSILYLKPATIIERMDKKKMINLISKIDFIPDYFFLEGIHSAELSDYLHHKFPNSKTVLRQANAEHLLLKRNAENSKNYVMKLILKIQQFLMYNYEKKALRKNDIITAVSEEDISEFKRMYPRGKYIPVLIFTNQKYHDKSKNRENKILAFGDWNWHPNRNGLNWFLKKVYPIIENLDFKLNIIGRGFDKSDFEQYSKINYLGFVDNLDKYFAESDMMIAPLLYGGGTKVKIIEALSNSIAVITTDYGNEGINAKDKEEILIANDEVNFAANIEILLKDKEYRLSLSDNAYNFASNKYNKDKIIDNLIAELIKIK